MAPCRGGWSSVLLLLVVGVLAIGLPVGGDSETPIEEKPPSSVKECRVHIEKALEQYWDQKQPPPQAAEQGTDQKTSIADQHDDDDDDDDEEDEAPLNNSEKNQDEEDDDDENDEDDDENDDDDDEENDADKDVNDKTDNADDDDDDNDINNADNNEEEDEDDDEEDVEQQGNDEEEEENDDDDDENEDQTVASQDEDDDEEDDDDEEENDAETAAVTESPEKNESDANNDDDDDDDEEEEEEDENDDEDDGDDDDISSTTTVNTQEIPVASQLKEELVVEAKSEIGQSNQSEANDEEEEDDNDDEDEENESVEPEEDEDEDEEEDDKEEVPAVDKLTTKSEQVTGGTNPASAGVASKLSDEKPNPQQSQTEKVEQKTVNVTPEQEEDDDDDDDDDDDNEQNASKQPEEADDDDDDDDEEDDDDQIENIYEDDEDESQGAYLTAASPQSFRSRDHIDVILGLDEFGTEYDKDEEKLAQSIFREIKKIEATSIKPIEMLYKYTDSTTRVLGDAEIFNKPMLLFLGPWSSGKSTIINYLLGIERTPAALKTGTGITDVDFTLVTYGDQRQVVSGTELAADWRYAGVQKFGQGFLDHFRSISVPHTLLKKVTIVDTPGILENRKNTERGYSFNDAFQWFIDRADAIYVVLDPTKVDIGGELGSVVDQLKGRDVRFILNKADTIRRSDLMRVVGQLFWNLSPLMSSTEAPLIYAVSLSTKPYHPSAPAKFLADQEKNFLYDMKDTLEKRVENRILYARRHAVRVRNHANMVDCYLATYYRHKSIFSNKKNVAKLIVENPREYNIFEELGSMTNISRYDLPDPVTYKDFFKTYALYDFKPLASTCSYFRGCPMEKLDAAIANELPELFTKYKKAKNSSPTPPKQEGR